MALIDSVFYDKNLHNFFTLSILTAEFAKLFIGFGQSVSMFEISLRIKAQIKIDEQLDNQSSGGIKAIINHLQKQLSIQYACLTSVYISLIVSYAFLVLKFVRDSD